MSSQQTIKRIAIFGSTGSIGTQALEVIAENPSLFSAEVLTAHNNDELLIEQALKFNPNIVVIGDDKKYAAVKDGLAATDIKVFAGEKALEEVASMDCYDLMLAAIVGYAGLRPTLKAIENGKAIALANKETLVVAGDIIMRKAVENRVPIIPVDSEHSAIFQCLIGELQHPNWSMGAKITIDSATLMNKGLEMIEAKWLFNLKPEQVQVVIHPQSIIHSMVQFEDGSVKAQMGLPDMKLPIQYALTFPQRIKNDFPRMDFKKITTLSFEEPDVKTFRNLALAEEALNKAGNLPCIMNAANEIAVFAFLRNRINFLDMTDLIEKTMNSIPFIEKPTLEEYFESDGEARNFAADLIQL